MVELGWIKIYFVLIPALQITAAVTGQHLLSFIVRVGDEVTLPCENVKKGYRKCDSTTWLFSGSGSSAAVELVKLGQIGKHAQAKSGKLSVTADCSLVIKNVTVEDVGRYDCQQYNESGKKQGQDAVVQLSVINMTEHKDNDKVTLNCSVLTHGQCGHTVKWLYDGKDVDKDNQDIKTSESTCSANVTFPKTSDYIYTSKKCNVKDGYTEKEQQFTFSPQSSGKETGEDTNVATTESTTTRTMEESTTLGPNKTESAKNDRAKRAQDLEQNRKLIPDWWWYILVAVGLAALLIIVVAVVRWRRPKANKTQMDDKIELTSNPAVTPPAPETSQDTADPEDGVCYASISHTKKTNSEARVWAKSDDDEGDAVTYSTVKASSSSAGASADPSDLYATVNEPNK